MVIRTARGARARHHRDRRAGAVAIAVAASAPSHPINRYAAELHVLTGPNPAGWRESARQKGVAP